MHTLMLLETATSTSITLRPSWLTHPRPLESNQIFSSVKASAHNSHSGLTITILTSTWPRLLSRLSRILWLLPLQQTRGGRFTVRYGFMLDRSAEVSNLFILYLKLLKHSHGYLEQSTYDYSLRANGYKNLVWYNSNVTIYSTRNTIEPMLRGHNCKCRTQRRLSLLLWSCDLNTH